VMSLADSDVTAMPSVMYWLMMLVI